MNTTEKNFPLFKVSVSMEECIDKIKTVLKSGFINEGNEVKELANHLIKILGSKNLVLTNSGTSALTIAYRLAGLKPNKNIISSPMTCIASNTPIINLGGDIKWSDIDPKSGMITKETIEDQIDENTVAVSFVNWGGVIAELDKIYDLCKSKKIFLIQDAAHSFMAEYKGLPICNYADFTCYSFQAIKHFTCGDGGAIILKDEKYLNKAKKLKWFGYDRENSKDKFGNWIKPQEEMDIPEGDVGYKFNMNNIAAAIGLSQVPKIEEIISKHINNGQRYNKHFHNHKKIFPIKQIEDSKSVYWIYTILLNETINKDYLIKELNNYKITSGEVHVPNNRYSCFKRFERELLGVEEFSKKQINLPCGWWLNDEDIDFIANTVKKIVN